MFGTAAGAPLRAMTSLAVIWILVRVILWNNSAAIVWNPVEPVISNIAHPDGSMKRQGLVALPVTAPTGNQYNAGSNRRYLSEYGAERGEGAFPNSERTASTTPALSWQQSDDVRSFFLRASFTRSGGDSDNPARTVPPFPNPRTWHQNSRMAVYFWIYARQDSSANQGGWGSAGRTISNGQYGGSQTGAILSYRLLDRLAPEISLYGRLSAALAPWSQEEIALGTRFRPLQNLPVALHAEQRFDASSGGDSGTAFFVTGGTGPAQFAEKFALETYAQAGYVLGPNETYFFDGSATLQRPIAESDGRKMSVGAGIWTGGQRDITRLDIGPRASFDLPVGNVLTRIAVDGRVRIAGNARPGSGAAITVSTGF